MQLLTISFDTFLQVNLLSLFAFVLTTYVLSHLFESPLSGLTPKRHRSVALSITPRPRTCVALANQVNKSFNSQGRSIPVSVQVCGPPGTVFLCWAADGAVGIQVARELQRPFD